MNSFGGPWTEEKLEILCQYLDAYTTALKNQPFNLIYVDAFAGEGYWRPRSEPILEDYEDFRELQAGSPRIALEVQDKPFDRFVFIEKDAARCESLERIQLEYPTRNIEIHNDDANQVLPIFCDNMGDFDRAVVFLDPFATSVSWDTLDKLAQTRKIDCWVLFPLSAIARMMPTDNTPLPALATQLDRVFGGRAYWKDFYQPSPQLMLFSNETNQERASGSEQIAERYRERLETVFAKVAPTRRVFRNSKNSPMFDLFFAVSNSRGASLAIEIADYILKRW